MYHRLFTLFNVSIILILVAGCGTTRRDKQLEKVAKDWSMTIRASQVIPVYPLTEDLVPGDVFLVNYLVNEQDQAYRKSEGFLPFDQHVARLDSFDYGDVYQSSHGTNEAGFIAPYSWIFPGKGSTDEASLGVPATDAGETEESSPIPTNWVKTPQASFPNYDITVKSGSSSNLALPLQSVAVAFALTHAEELSVSVKLKDAKVYGVPLEQIIPRILEWSLTPANAAYLQSQAPANGEDASRFLRVVNRVYLIEGVDVSANATSNFGAGADASVAKALGNSLAQVKQGILPGDASSTLATTDDGSSSATPSADDSDSGEASAARADSAYQNTVNEINAQLESASNAPVPGGGVKLALATARSVLLKETFRRPLVVGYLGFDFPILKDGRLGAPVSTFNAIYTDQKLSIGNELDVVKFSPSQMTLGILFSEAKSMSPEDQEKVFKAVVSNMPASFQSDYDAEVTKRKPWQAYSIAMANANSVPSDGRLIEYFENAILTLQ